MHCYNVLKLYKKNVLFTDKESRTEVLLEGSEEWYRRASSSTPAKTKGSSSVSTEGLKKWFVLFKALAHWRALFQLTSDNHNLFISCSDSSCSVTTTSSSEGARLCHVYGYIYCCQKCKCKCKCNSAFLGQYLCARSVIYHSRNQHKIINNLWREL